MSLSKNQCGACGMPKRPNKLLPMRTFALALLLFFAACAIGLAEAGEGDGRFVMLVRGTRYRTLPLLGASRTKYGWSLAS